MKLLRLLAAWLMTCVLVVSLRADDRKDKPDNARLLVGKWEVTAATKELPVGARIEFTRDGKMKITAEDVGKQKDVEAVYRVDGDKIHFTLKLKDKDEKKNPLTIKKISEQELILEAEKGLTLEFKRVK